MFCCCELKTVSTEKNNNYNNDKGIIVVSLKDDDIIHFMGIGGIGMSGIAKVLNHMGYTVRGSDISSNNNIKTLENLGVHIDIGQKPDNIYDAELNSVKATIIVITNVIKEDNLELVEAKKHGLPIYYRSDLLAFIMTKYKTVAIAGSHGKTTTTSLTSNMLQICNMNPSIINGGILQSHNTNAHIGDSEWMVVEADESDGSLVKLPTNIGVITNIDFEHADYYKDMDQLIGVFLQFITNIKPDGYAIYCTDDPVLKDLDLPAKFSDKKLISYGFSDGADIQAINVRIENRTSIYDVKLNIPGFNSFTIQNIHLPIPGQHNVLNSLATIAIGMIVGLGGEDIKQGLSAFQGVLRRFTLVGNVNDITFIDDYGHHPTEIEQVLKTARQSNPDGRVIAVIQPHKFSRIQNFYDGYVDCSQLADECIYMPVHTAGETLIPGCAHSDVIKSINEKHPKKALELNTDNELYRWVIENAKPHDMVLFLGAGTISKMAYTAFDNYKNHYGL